MDWPFSSPCVVSLSLDQLLETGVAMQVIEIGCVVNPGGGNAGRTGLPQPLERLRIGAKMVVNQRRRKEEVWLRRTAGETFAQRGKRARAVVQHRARNSGDSKGV